MSIIRLFQTTVLVGILLLALPMGLFAAKKSRKAPNTNPTSQAAIATQEEVTDVAAEEQRFEKTYGNRFAAVQQTPDEGDDRAFAEELLLEAENQLLANFPIRAFVLSRKIQELTASLTDDKASLLAKKAIAIQVKAKGLPHTDHVMLWRENALARLETVKAKQKDCIPLARIAVDASLDYAQTLSKEPESIQAVSDALADAAALISQYKLGGLNERLAMLQKTVQEIKAREERIATLNQKLVALSDDPKQSLVIKRELGDLYLKSGNITHAAKFFAGTGDHREAALATAAAFLDDSGAVPSSFPKAIEKLTAIAKISNEPARTALASCAQNMCAAFLDSNPSEDKIAALAPFQSQIEAITGIRVDNELVQKLQNKFGPLKGRIDTLSGGRVRLTYNFSKEEQIKDWVLRGEGQWGITNGLLACKTRVYGMASIAHKVRFLSDKPWKISFTVSTPNRFGANFGEYFYGSNACSVMLDKIGLTLGIYDNTWVDNSIRLLANGVYRIALEFDGKKQFKCSLNGRAVSKEDIKSAVLRARLFLFCEYSGLQPTAFDDVVIEGKPAFNLPADMAP